jgi:hypothetical protein
MSTHLTEAMVEETAAAQFGAALYDCRLGAEPDDAGERSSTTDILLEKLLTNLRFARIRGCFWESTRDLFIQVRWQIPEFEKAFLHFCQRRQ